MDYFNHLPEANAPSEFRLAKPMPCSYFEDKTEQFLVALAPQGMKIGKTCASFLSRKGFRRSGIYQYRPHCPGCSRCISVRVRVKDFLADRSMLRCMKLNRKLKRTVKDVAFYPEQYELFLNYLSIRHKESSMNQMSPQDFIECLLLNTAPTQIAEYRDETNKLVMFSVEDLFDDGLSAAYTCYEPTMPRYSLGTFGILSQIKEAVRLNLPYVYLGFWIKEADNMKYKNRFQPLEVFYKGSWLSYEKYIEIDRSIKRK